ncbi:MAG: N-acetylglucosamine-6-phosphate deacetylase, partial [Chloroflexota bacterium]
MSSRAMVVTGRLILGDRVENGRITIEGDWIVRVESGGADAGGTAMGTELAPYIAPGFVDVHVHGGGGHDAMGGADALDGMARHLLRHGVTAFLPTAVTAPLP